MFLSKVDGFVLALYTLYIGMLIYDVEIGIRQQTQLHSITPHRQICPEIERLTVNAQFLAKLTCYIYMQNLLYHIGYLIIHIIWTI